MTLDPTNSHGGSGGGAVTIADGADVVDGATTDAANTTGTTGTNSGKLRGIVQLLAGALKAGGSVASDIPVTDNPLLDGGRASTAIPTAVSADGDAVASWLSRNGAMKVEIVSGVATPIGSALYTQQNIGDGQGFSAQYTPVVTTANYLYDAVNSWDRERGNYVESVLASAARTVATSSSDITNYNGRGILLVVNVTVEGAATLTLTVQGKDSVSGNYYELITGIVVYTAATDAPPTTRAIMLYPGTLSADAIGIAGATGMTSKQVAIPRVYRATITPADATTTTYSVSGVTLV